MNMSSEDIYKVARNIFGRYGAFFKIVVREIGMEKALELHAEAHRDLGVATADTIRESMKGVEFNLETLGPLLRDGNISHGLMTEMVETPCSILLRNSRCPVYDGYRMAGLDNVTAKALCQYGAIAKIGTTVNLLNPKLSYELTHYRSKPDESCVEEIKPIED